LSKLKLNKPKKKRLKLLMK